MGFSLPLNTRGRTDPAPHLGRQRRPRSGSQLYSLPQTGHFLYLGSIVMETACLSREH